MKARTTLALLALVLVLGGYAYLYEYRRAEDGKTRGEAFAFNPDSVLRITLSRGGSRIAFEREPGRPWRIREPLSTSALPRAMEEVLGALAHLEIRNVLPGARPSPAYALAPAEASVTFSTAQGEKALLLGTDTVDGSTTYACRADRSEVLLIPKAEADKLRKPLNDYRDKALAASPPGGISHLRLVYPDRVLSLRHSRGAWSLEEPVKAFAGKEETDRMVEALLSTRADTFVSDDVKDWAPYGLDRPRLTVEMHPTGDGQPSGFSIGAALPKKPFERGEGFYARPLGSSSVMTVRLARIDDYVKEVRHVRPRRILRGGWDGVTRVSLEGPAGTLTVDRPAPDRWEASVPHQGLMDLGPFNRAVSLPIQALEASVMEPSTPERRAALGFDRPLGRISLQQTEGAEQILTIWGVDETSKEAWLTSSGEDLLFTVPISVRDILNHSYLELRDPILFVRSIGSIRRLEVERASGNLAYESPAKGQWSRLAPERREGPFPEVAALVTALTELRASKWLAFGPVDWKAYGLEPSAAAIRVATRDGNEPEQAWRIELGRSERPGAAYARVDGGDELVEIPSKLLDLALAP